MEIKTTRKEIVRSSANLKKCGYCDLYHLLRNHSRIAYTSGVYGWNFDVFEVYGVTICTGYRNMPGERAEGIAEYEKRAEAIRENFNMSYDERAAAVEALLVEFCKLNGGSN